MNESILEAFSIVFEFKTLHGNDSAELSWSWKFKSRLTSQEIPSLFIKYGVFITVCTWSYMIQDVQNRVGWYVYLNFILREKLVFIRLVQIKYKAIVKYLTLRCIVFEDLYTVNWSKPLLKYEAFDTEKYVRS
jgi:hypothetical protein